MRPPSDPLNPRLLRTVEHRQAQRTPALTQLVYAFKQPFVLNLGATHTRLRTVGLGARVEHLEIRMPVLKGSAQGPAIPVFQGMSHLLYIVIARC